MKKKSHNNIYTIIKNKKIKNKIKNKYSEKNHEKRRKKEKSYLNVIASEAKEKEKISLSILIKKKN
jgi:hypothetical protein